MFVHVMDEVRLTITLCEEDYFIGIIDPNEISLIRLVNYTCQAAFNRNWHDDEPFSVQVTLSWNNKKVLIESDADLFKVWEEHNKFDLFDINVDVTLLPLDTLP